MSDNKIIRCADRREFAKLPQQRIDEAHQIWVGDTLVKNRGGTCRAKG